jgi:high affinity choline transporter 7
VSRPILRRHRHRLFDDGDGHAGIKRSSLTGKEEDGYRIRSFATGSVAVQLAAIAIFYALIFGVGMWAARRDTGAASDLILGGRRLPTWVGFCTMTATWVGGGYILGTSEAVYDDTRGLLWAQAPWGYAGSLILGGLLFARPMYRRGFTTMLDPFEQRYGKHLAALLFIPALIGEVFWSAAILTALGTTFGLILDYDVGTSIVVSAAIAIGYTMVGGLRAVAYTDVVELACIALGLGVALPFALERSGGLSATLDAYAARFGDHAALFPPLAAFGGSVAPAEMVWLWFDGALLLILGGIPWQVYFQRVLACRSEDAAARMSLGAGVGCAVMAIPPVLIGMAAATADWPAIGLPRPVNAAAVLPEVLRDLTPQWVAVVGLAAVAAAVMSSVDSSVLSASSLFVCNVYRPLLRSRAGAAEIGRITRVSSAVIGALATLLALRVQSVYGLWYLCADLVYVVLFPQLVMVLWSSRANHRGAAAGMVVALLLRLGGGEPLLGIPAFLPYPMPAEDGSTLFPFRTFAMVASLVTIHVVSRWRPNGKAET